MSEKIYYTIINKGYESLSELELELDKDVLGDIDYDMAWPEGIGDRSRVDGSPVKIDTLIKILQNFKNKGANYVSLDANDDHHGYKFEAYS